MRSLAQVQVDADRQRLAGDPALLRRKWTRMSASPFAFLRGASSLWAEALTRRPEYLGGFPGRGAVVGDLHLENFGTFNTRRGFTFHINDFDETFTGLWAFDVLRLLTSVLLSRAEFSVTGTAVLGLAEAVVDGHAIGVGGARLSRPSAIDALVAHAESVPPDKLLAKELEGPRRLRRTEKTPDAPAWARRSVKATLATWAKEVASPLGYVADVTRRIAGTGSLGVARLLVLATDAPRGDGLELLEVKEIRGTRFTRAASADRLVATMKTALPLPPLDIAAARLDGLPVLVKPRGPGEEKLAVSDFPRDDLERLCRFYGFLTGELHRRGAEAPARWSPPARRRLVENASALAGAHQEAFVEFCAAARRVVEGRGGRPTARSSSRPSHR